MQGLEGYFEKPQVRVTSKQYIEGTIGNVLRKSNGFANSAKNKIALIGVNEGRNSYNENYDTDVELIREYLYELAFISKTDIVDFGNLKRGNQVKDTYASIKYVTSKFVNDSIIPVYFGSSHDLLLSIMEGFESIRNENSTVIIDSRIDALDEEMHARSFLNHINKGNHQISVLGFQTYFITESILQKAEANAWDLFRLGLIRQNPNQVEPLLRDANLVSFDMSSVRQSEYPASSLPSPNGLYADEICQLAHMAGLSDTLQAISLNDYISSKDTEGRSAHLAAQVIWHFIQGISQRKFDYPVQELANYKKIYVKMEKLEAELVFYENTLNKRYWVEIPVGSNSNKIVSCSENDYRQACNNEIPDRIWKNISRYLK